MCKLHYAQPKGHIAYVAALKDVVWQLWCVFGSCTVFHHPSMIHCKDVQTIQVAEIEIPPLLYGHGKKIVLGYSNIGQTYKKTGGNAQTPRHRVLHTVIIMM